MSLFNLRNLLYPIYPISSPAELVVLFAKAIQKGNPH